MLSETMTALAAAGGTAVVQAAGTDAWTEVRQEVARWFGRGSQQRESAELERLDQTAGELDAAQPTDAERVRIRQEAAWQARIEAVLEGLEDIQRTRVADELRTLLAQQTSHSGVSASQSGLAVGGDVNVRADHGSAAAVSMGNVTLGNPPQPGSHQD
ncbi:hypothetical protein ACM01_43510 [Streptomyces viridochromogenes]|uniref:Uncharacterized protein n=1 Tax=Streptomyces viridochromogenes TaxID=1938 RepID=A0A0J7YU91_STRVR|nr:hypothetical protein [Streptomyces viridochromogenes]KMS67236.1 hypothetical protein ACM01_43510 [Streptomyces viridochromogenes]KOG26339.1 hypothetical protein ADK36_03440 [Streptomyces viridochromogenes]KOG27989.1 hypothetical protein ADK35_04550 [Streptomyces viridochromogenes]